MSCDPTTLDVDAFTRQLRELTDRQAITDLVARLGLWLDDQRFDEAASVLTADVTVDTPGGTARGIDLVAAQAHRNHDDHRTQHLLTNVLVDLDGDRATASANVLVTFTVDAASPVVHNTQGGRYRFGAARTPDGWRLSTIQVEQVWATGAPAVPRAAG